MKTTTNFNFFKTTPLILAFTAVFAWGCSNNDDGGDKNPAGFCDQLITKSQEYSDVVNAFQANPSKETCNNVRNAALEFIDAVQDCSEFSEQYADLEKAAEGWTNLDCTDEFGD